MNQLQQVRYSKKVNRVINRETGKCERVWIGKGTITGEPVGLRLAFDAPDGKETVILINDPGTLERLCSMISAVRAEQAQQEYIRSARASGEDL